MPGESQFNLMTFSWPGELGGTRIGNIWDIQIKRFFVKLNYVLFNWGGCKSRHKTVYTVGGYGGVTFKNKYTYKVNSFFFVLFHVRGVEGTLYGYNTLNDTHVKSVERNKIERVQIRLVSEVSEVHNRESSNLIVYMSEVSKLFL